MRLLWAAAAVALARGCPRSSFDPAALVGGAVTVLDATPRRLSPPGLFNPSVAPLPAATRAALRRGGLGGDPRYLVAFRARGNFRALLCGVETPPSGRWSRVCVADGDLREVACAADDVGSYDLFLLERHGALYATSTVYGHARKRGGARRPFGRFLVRSLTVGAANGTLSVAAAPLERADARPPTALDVDVWGKNLGVLWDGRDASPLRLVHWLADPMDARAGVPPRHPPRPDAVPLAGPGGRRLHGNGSPAPLGDDCPGLALSVGHVHTDAVNASRYGAARRYPSTVYVHALIIWREADGAVLAASAPFCFAALGGARGACDLIQFVSGLVVADRSVLLAYGTDDCAGAVARLPLRAAVDRAFRGDAARAAAACPALASPR